MIAHHKVKATDFSNKLAKRGLEKYSRLYNQSRPHSSLDDKTPDEFYYDNLPALPKAA
jgi:putative transposase